MFTRVGQAGSKVLIFASSIFIASCVASQQGGDVVASQQVSFATEEEATTDKRIVDCLLQGQIRKLGSTVYQAPPRPAKLPARDCEIRGGDFLVFDRANFASSLGHWLGLAKAGDTKAMVYVAEIFERGLGRDPDYEQAAVWYQRAAETGDPVAQISLAQMYEKGLGVQQDPAIAEQLYRDAFGPGVSDNVAINPASLGDPADRTQRLEQQLKKTREDAAALEQQLAAAQQNLSSAESDLRQRQAQEQRLLQQLEQAKNQVSVAASGSVELETARQQLNRRNEELADQQYTIARLEEEISRNESQIVAYEGEIDRVAELEARIQQQAALFEKANAELRDTRVALVESNARLEQQQQEFEAERLALQADRERLIASVESSSAQPELEAQLRERESRLAEQSRTLDSMRAEIDAQKTQSLQLQSRLTELRRQNEQLVEVRSEAQRYRDESERLRVALQDTQNQLITIEAKADNSEEMEQMRAELQRVMEEADRYKNRLTVLETAQEKMADLSGPEIQLIEPVAFNTRGEDGEIVVTGRERLPVIGKISAPAGLLSLMVNKEQTQVNANNVFQTQVDLTGESTAVRITAIDSQGKRSETIFNFINKAIRAKEIKASIPDVEFGKFHALLIGNEKYAMLPNLETPEEDIDAIGAILRDRYDFDTTIIKDGTREEIMDGMYKLLGKLTSKDNLLIYYAGHGEYVTDTNRGVWLPVDANPESPANWITNVEINDYLKQIAAKQIVVIADSCYSGSLTRSAMINLRPGLTDEEYEAHLERMTQIQARVVLTSGGLAPVLDSANPGASHSIFAAALIDILNQNEAVLSAQDLGRTIAAKVSLAASRVGYEQEPQYAPLNHANHQGGDFFFVPLLGI